MFGLKKYIMTIPLALLLFFMLVGFVTNPSAPWLGMFAGAIEANVGAFFLPLSLIPFAGTPIWLALTSHLFGIIGMGTISSTVLLLEGTVSGIICGLTSVLSGVGLYYLFRKKKKVLSTKRTFDIPEQYKNIIKSIPQIDISKMMNVQDIINQIIDLVKGFIDKLDMNLVMDIVFWFGLGIATHDFWWEDQKENVDATRPTHGADIGLEMALFALDYQISQTTPNFFDKIKKEIPLYLGFVTAYIGFLSTKILPKGFPRLISNFFWWTGISLMVYNWYEVNKDKIFPPQSIEEKE
jgi:hypothetical protein